MKYYVSIVHQYILSDRILYSCYITSLFHITLLNTFNISLGHLRFFNSVLIHMIELSIFDVFVRRLLVNGINVMVNQG